MILPEHEIRAFFTPTTIRVYQAYSDEIADSAIRHQTFVSPPFSMTRMTWIKPSFLWMMYRSGWGKKDRGQKRILAIDITHSGFMWAITHGCPSHPSSEMSNDEWRELMARSPVRIQWDPERDLLHNPLPHRAIQIGLSGEAVSRYTTDWIVNIEDITKDVGYIHDLVRRGELSKVSVHLPPERPYMVGMNQRIFIENERERLLQTSHQDHEEIVRLLQDYPENESVPYLRKAIQLKPMLNYLNYDDYGAFYKKCLWALQVIGTYDAVKLIQECAVSEELALQEQATYRLRRIDEGSRKGV